MKGNLFIIEGPDGVGKTTIVQELRANLQNHNFEFLSFPGRSEGTLGKLIYHLHHHPEEFGIRTMSELAKQALHVSAHIDVIESRIRPWITEGKNVVLDRFWWSTLVYGDVGGGAHKALRDLVSAEQTVWGEIVPKTAFLIDRDTPIDRREDLSYWRRLRTSYVALAAEEARKYKVLTIRNTGALTDAVNEIMAHILRT